MELAERCSEKYLSTQYTLSMHIGHELELAPMLRVFLVKAVPLLSARSGYVWVRNKKGNGFRRFTYPDNLEGTIVPIIEREISQKAKNNGCEIRSGYLFQHKTEAIHIFRLGKVGFFALRCEKPLGKDLVAALLPIIDRLADACITSLRYESKLAQHKSTVQALHETIHEVDTRDELIASLSEKIIKPVTQAKFCTDGDNAFAVLEASIGLVAQELRQFSALRESELALAEEDIAVADFVSSIIEPFSLWSASKDIEVTHYIDENVPLVVNTDEQKLSLVLRLLLDNAVKNTDRGTIRLTVSEGDIDVSQSLKFEVSDTGAGMVQEQVKAILASGFQAANEFGEHPKITEFRLSLVKKLIHSMGGRLEVKSVLGVGSVFSFSAKAESVVSEYAPEGNQVVDKTPLEKVALIAEDNAVTRMVARKILENFGYCVVEACNGNEAIAMWGVHHPELVLMDVNMPVMDGVHATYAIRELEKSASIRTPILAMVTNMNKKVQDQCLGAGVDYFLSKPFTPKILGDAIDQSVVLASRPQVKIGNL